MDDSDNMSTDDSKSVDSLTTFKTKPKKRSLVERELETNLTARVTSPVTNAESTSRSRYGRARRLKTELESPDLRKLESPKALVADKSPVRVQSPVYKMHASNTPIKTVSPKESVEYLDNQIENIYQENISLSRFASNEMITSSPVKKISKVYIQKDLIQRKDTDDPVVLIKNIFSPEKNSNKINSHLNNILERSERFNMNLSKQNCYSLENSSVVKALDFDSKKKKTKDKVLSKNELFELEAKCMFQVGDLAWARMGTYPFWPCIITRDPDSGMFVKKKLFGRVEHDIIHVTFFGDNGRRSWIVDNMLRNYTGLAEFESTRDLFTMEDKKRDPRLYAAFFISEKKQALWRMSVDEAETLYKEPKRLRIDLFNEMLEKSRAVKTTPKVQRKVTRTDSDVSLSESLYDSLFSEDDGKVDDSERSRNKSRNKSLDVSEVVTACLDNMAAKTGITKIQKQSHMDRWLQKAKSQTPEKVQVKTQVLKVIKINNNRKWKIIPKEMIKPYSLRRSANESLTLLFNQNEHDYSKVLPDIFKVDTNKNDSKVEMGSNLNEQINQKSPNNTNEDESFTKETILENESKSEVNLNQLVVKKLMNSDSVENNKDNTVSSKKGNLKSSNLLNPLNEPLNNVTVSANLPEKIVYSIDMQMEVDSNSIAKTLTIDNNNSSTKPTERDMGTLKVQLLPEIIVMKSSETENEITLKCKNKKHNKEVATKTGSISTNVKKSCNDSEIKVLINQLEEGPSNNKSCKNYNTEKEDIELRSETEITHVNNVVSKSTELIPSTDIDHQEMEVNFSDDMSSPQSANVNNKIETNKEIPLSVLEMKTSLLTNDKVDDISNKETGAILQETDSNTNTQEVSVDLDTYEETSKISCDQKNYKAKKHCVTTLVDNDLTSIVLDEMGKINPILNKVKNNLETEILAESGTDPLTSDARTGNTPEYDESNNESTINDNLRIAIEVNTGIDESNDIINDCKLKEINIQEENNDSNIVINEENKEAKVGTCNINLDNRKITEDNFLNNESKADNFIFLDKSTDKTVDLSKEINGYLNDENDMKNNDIDVCKYGIPNNDSLKSSIDNRSLPNNTVNVEHKDNIILSGNEDDDNSTTSVQAVCETIENEKSFIEESEIKSYKNDSNITHSNFFKHEQKDLKENIEKKSALCNETKNIQTHNENNTSGDNSLEIKVNGEYINDYISNSPESNERNVSHEIPTTLLDINFSSSINHNTGTRSFLDNLKSLELAICNDIAKLGMPFTDPEKLTPTPISPALKPERFENDIKDDTVLKECLENNKENITFDQDNKKLDLVDNKNEDLPQSDTIEQNCEIIEEKKQTNDIKDSNIHSKSPEENYDTFKIIDDNKTETEAIVNEVEEVKNTKLDQENNSSGQKDIKGTANVIETGEQIVSNKVAVYESNILTLGDKEINIPNTFSGSVKEHKEMEDVESKNNNIEPKIHNKLIETVKELHYMENGLHDSDSPDLKDSDDEFDIDAVSINSEDSAVSLNKTDKYYKRKLRVKADRTLDDPDFLKYLEMRQDTLIEENPGLTDDEIISYLYKTYLYEESQKSDLRKNDDIEQANMVKGLSEHANKKNRLSRSVRDSLFQKKKIKLVQKDFYEESDTASVTSDNDISCHNKVATKSELVVSMSDKVNSKGDRLLKISKVNKSLINSLPNATIANETKNIPETDNKDKTKSINVLSNKSVDSEKTERDKIKDIKKESDALLDTKEMEVPLRFRKMRTKVKETGCHEKPLQTTIKEETSSDSQHKDVLITQTRKLNNEKKDTKFMENPAFLQYLELRQDSLIDENPQLTHEEIIQYLYKTWIYEEDQKSEDKKADEIEQLGLVKGLTQISEKRPKIKKKAETDRVDDSANKPREKPRRKASKPFYNEEYSDLEDELEVFEIFKQKPKINKSPKENPVKVEDLVEIETEPMKSEIEITVQNENETWEDEFDEVEYYFEQLTQPKPNVFKGLIREKVCEICEAANNLIKCKTCHGMFHVDCVKKAVEIVKVGTPPRSRKKKKPGRKPKSLEDSESQSDEKCLDISEEQNISIEDIKIEPYVIDADVLEQQLSVKMKEILDNLEAVNYDSYSSDDGIDWVDTVPGKCEIVDVKFKKRKKPIHFANFKCNNCQKYDTPVCFVCKSPASKSGNEFRQKCNVAHCHKYYHLECLDHWPQTQFNAGEPSKNNKKINQHFEALSCPRHVCHTCVSDDPRGCKTRFSGDKLARCVRCPATYHSFTKCVPAGTKILTGSQVICPRHHELRPGKVPCHVNTGWCFICALGGTLICCEYCPTSFHAECLNIDPPEGGYMCEDCETGRLPLYGEMVWVKLGNYRWWPGIILHPSEIPENLLSVRHSLGEFVVRFFGQYDHYWVNRGRVFPFQEGDSGRVSGQKSKIDAAFTTAMEHAQRACEILKLAEPNEEESLDIASSLLPPHYVKLKTNKPIGSVSLKKIDDPELSLTQCECDPNEEDPCGPYSQCLNRMLLTECGPTCRAGDRCNNRAFEKRLYPKLTPYRTHHRGWGLKTLDDIKAGQFVIEYVGELIDEEEFRRRMRRKHEIRDENYYFLTLDKERMIDAGPKGNLARFMNHCCEPNCETQKWTVLGDVRVGLFALHDIPANSEVTFNYNLECAGIEKKRCLCGAKRCSGYMGAKPKQEEPQTKKNKQPKRTYKKRKVELSPMTPKKHKRLGRPPKNKELTEIEKDLLIIRSATNLSSDDSDFIEKPKALKRKRVNFSSEEAFSDNKKTKTDVDD